MKRIRTFNTKSVVNKKSNRQLVKDWETAKKKLEKKIASEKNSKERTKLEIYHTFFSNHLVDKKQGTIKERDFKKKSSNIYCGSAEIK